MKKIIRAIFAAGLGLAAFQSPAQAQDSIESVRSRGVLRIPGIINEDPYFNKDPRTGEWRGFAIEMARDIAKTLGVKLEVVESSWPNSILDVQSGKVDLALGVTATPQRAMSVAFSAPTYFNSFVIVSPNEELANASWADLNSPDVTIAVDTGSAQDNIARAYLPRANMLRFQTRDEAVIAVATGRADALINTVLNSMVMRSRNPAIGDVYVPEPRLSSPSVIGVNYAADEQFKTFVSAWANYNRQMGNNQTWIVGGMAPFGITMDDLPPGFDFGG